MPARCPKVAEAVEEAQALLAKLSIQLEAADPEEALALLHGHQATLQQHVTATRPKPLLLQLPRELNGLIIRQLMRSQEGATAGALNLRSSCSFYDIGAASARYEHRRSRARGVGFALFEEECARLCPALARDSSGEGLIDYTLQLLRFEEWRRDGDTPDSDSGSHTSFTDVPLLVEALVHLEVQAAREVLTPCGFVVGEVGACSAQGGEWEKYLQVCCSVPGLPGTLHEGALHECNILFRRDEPDDRDEALRTGTRIYPWDPPLTFIRGQGYHAMLRGGTAELGRGAIRHSRLLNPSKRNWDPSYCLTEVLLHVQSFIHSHNLQDPGNEEPYVDAKNNVPLFREKVRSWALSTQAARPLPPPPEELVEAILALPGSDGWPLDTHSYTAVELGGQTWRIYRDDNFRPSTDTRDVVNGQLAPRETLP